MLHFFRHIRRSLFPLCQGSEGRVLPGKVRTYFAYAFGEIVLIVVGILLALQVSEWNQNRANRKLECQYIDRLIKDFESDVNSYETFIVNSEMRLEFAALLIDSANNNEVALSRPVEFLVAVAKSGNLETPALSSDTFEELRSTGHLGLLKNELISELYGYYRLDEFFQTIQNNISDMVTFKYRELAAGVLSVEQKQWVSDHVGGGLKAHRDIIRELTVEKDFVVDAVERLQSRAELVSWIPEVRGSQIGLQSTLQLRLKKAEAVLETLKATQARYETSH